jgi:hypothetical protein
MKDKFFLLGYFSCIGLIPGMSKEDAASILMKVVTVLCAMKTPLFLMFLQHMTRWFKLNIPWNVRDNFFPNA